MGIWAVRMALKAWKGGNVGLGVGSYLERYWGEKMGIWGVRVGIEGMERWEYGIRWELKAQNRWEEDWEFLRKTEKKNGNVGLGGNWRPRKCGNMGFGVESFLERHWGKKRGMWD